MAERRFHERRSPRKAIFLQQLRNPKDFLSRAFNTVFGTICYVYLRFLTKLKNKLNLFSFFYNDAVFSSAMTEKANFQRPTHEHEISLMNSKTTCVIENQYS